MRAGARAGAGARPQPDPAHEHRPAMQRNSGAAGDGGTPVPALDQHSTKAGNRYDLRRRVALIPG